MSTVQRINFEPVTDILPLHRRDFPLADPTLADPTNSSTGTVDGEWMTLNSSNQLIRGAVIGGGPNVSALLRSFPLWAERGRYDVQAMSGRKMPIIYLGNYEFDTRIFDATATVTGAGAAGVAMTLFGGLKVASITLGTRVYSGLVGHGGFTDQDPVVGYVTRLPGSNGNKLRFMSGWRQ